MTWLKSFQSVQTCPACMSYFFPLFSGRNLITFMYIYIYLLTFSVSLFYSVLLLIYRKHPKNSDIWKICCNHSKILTKEGMANWSDCSSRSIIWSTLFAKTCLSKNIGLLEQYQETTHHQYWSKLRKKSTQKWAASSKSGTYRLCEQRRFRRACAPRSLARTSTVRSYKQWVKRNLQTESQIPSPYDRLGMRS